MFEYPHFGGLYLACQFAFGSNSVELFGCDNEDEDLMFARDASLSGLLPQRWRLRMMAREAALREAANSKLRLFSRTVSPLDARMSRLVIRRFAISRPTAKIRLVGAAWRNFWILIKRGRRRNFEVKPSTLQDIA